MAAYYARRAAEYERIYQRPERQAELQALQAWLGRVFAGRRVLELAAGTGWWTQAAAAQAHDWLATDLNPEPLAVAQAKPMPAAVRWALTDAYTLAELGPPPAPATRAPFDAAFVGCWWSHVPRARLADWLRRLHAHLAPGARVLMLDNRHTPYSTPLQRRDGEGNTYQWRRLDDGSTHEVLKNYPSHEQAVAALGPSARWLQLTPFTHFWVLDYRVGDGTLAD